VFFILLKKDVSDYLKTFRFAAALITIFALVLVSVWVLGEDYLQKRQEYNKLAESYAQTATEVRVPSEILPTLFRPVSALSIFAQGQDVHLGNAVQIRRWEVPNSAQDSLSVNRLLYSMPSFDLLSIFIFAVSLFGVLLSYDAFSGEKERGTLKLICSCNVKKGLIFTVKFLAGVLALSIPILISLVGGLIVLQFLHGITFSGPQWTAVALMILAILLYGALFIAVGLLCSVLVNRSSVSLALALLLWTVGVVLVPSLGNSSAPMLQSLYPREEISKFMQQTSTQLDKDKRAFVRENRLNLSSHGSGSIGYETPYWIEGQKEWLLDHMKFIAFCEAKYQDRALQHWNLIAEHDAKKREQYALGNLIKGLSPAHHFRSAFTALAATDFGTHEEFMDQCRRYRQKMLESYKNMGLFDEKVNLFFTRHELSEMTPEQVSRRISKLEDDYAQKKIKDWHDIYEPLSDEYFVPFEYQGGQPNFADAAWPMAALAFLTILFFGLGFVASIRYDVR
jgi:ABC-type transport system involved in multi-copper enzyme maturation permease subunit